MFWIKKGLLIKPQKNLWWMQSHAMVPTISYLNDDNYKVYFSGRDKHNISYIGHAVIKVNKKIEVLSYSREPDLYPGDLGCFDDNGVTPSWIIDNGKQKFLYYIGWNKRSRVRMSLVAGLAISNDGGKTFNRFSKAPLLERTNLEPLSILTAPCVLKEKNLWRMWYVSGLFWKNEDLPYYNIKYATSSDGINWKRDGIVAVSLLNNEHALARPCVVNEKNGYKMWFSAKEIGSSYKIFVATSRDGVKWRRLRKGSNLGLDISKSGWDSEMVEYGYIFRHKQETYILYNGNDYGKQGIGYATYQKN